MALQVGALISTAVKLNYSLIGNRHISKAALLEELNVQDALVMKMIAQANPDAFSTVTGVITLSDSGNLNGYTLSQGIHYRDFAHADTTQEKYTKVNIVQRQHRDAGVQNPAGMFREGASAGVFYPIDPLNKRWLGSETREWFEPDSGHTVTYSYIPFPTPVSALTSNLTSPDMAREVFITALEMRIILMCRPENEVETAAWSTHLETATALYGRALQALQMQVYKVATPEGQPAPNESPVTEAEWVASQLG